ncbi:hypothetical protein EP30_05290 [Bifidobacterium sp. UTCIF-39]|uniref:ImmA/IrrE family metallo-endopeptidase n=1 Tax=Bifidobacterium sp. UTCIF-39 TaxID=1465359 RepID=UPI001129A4BC|nr:ImmA/IrrE family metallo-endopeptidase [Bifidobacterium sp. UTCIF-39]TPF96834.1 hypothetical protein EP30_05290 [Bifidobacterium sp. UTCIF-39]
MNPLPITPGMDYDRILDAITSLHPHLRIDQVELPDDLAGACCPNIDVILIDQNQTDTRKKCALVHELVHYQHGDDTSHGWAAAKAENRCRRKTALLLINPIEYATAEQMYDGDIWRISHELGVTTQVIHDYQHILRETHIPLRA